MNHRGCSDYRSCLYDNSSSQNSKLQAAGAEHSLSPGIKAPWSLASFRPAPPIYALKTFGKPDAVDSCRSTKTCTMLDFDPLHKVNDRASFMHSRVGNWETCEDRWLSETVKALKSQMTDLQSQVSQLCKQLEEERKSRLSLAATVKRSMAVIDGAVP
ncbi:hypothetical protein TSAR_006801 [Trichomalopsis sarcophagae]|uniref:Rho guanine nucleotide exchange factor 6/7 coiled-coil domain-containing protein n=1 Tax=Trichomalopsis sarcophagae TaxID=543379 RepID=A0A232FE24_9HYME|nr:hypothetical protein TSAR_006801 [Trichomalopsis sarcophagae]